MWLRRRTRAPAAPSPPVCGPRLHVSADRAHTDPRFTLRCYTQAARRRERLSGPHLRAYHRALGWARMGTIAVPEEFDEVESSLDRRPVEWRYAADTAAKARTLLVTLVR